MCCGEKDCDEKTEWIRHTQFAGSHPFCDKCARKEKDFLHSDSYLFWEKVEQAPID